MGLAFWLYAVDFISNIDSVFFFILFSYITLLVIFGLVWLAVDVKEYQEALYLLIKKIVFKWWVAIIVLFLSVFIPNQKTMYMMLGASYLSQSNLPEKVSKILDSKLDNVLEEMNDLRKKKVVLQVKD